MAADSTKRENHRSVIGFYHLMNNLAQNIKPEPEEPAYIQVLMYRKYRRQRNMGNYTGNATLSVGNRIVQMIQYIQQIAKKQRK